MENTAAITEVSPMPRGISFSVMLSTFGEYVVAITIETTIVNNISKDNILINFLSDGGVAFIETSVTVDSGTKDQSIVSPMVFEYASVGLGKPTLFYQRANGEEQNIRTEKNTNTDFMTIPRHPRPESERTNVLVDMNTNSAVLLNIARNNDPIWDFVLSA